MAFSLSRPQSTDRYINVPWNRIHTVPEHVKAMLDAFADQELADKQYQDAVVFYGRRLLGTEAVKVHNQSGAVPLFKLPAELRNIIYGMVLPKYDNVRVKISSNRTSYERHGKDHMPRSSKCLEPAISCTSALFRRESLPMYYAQSTFFFRCRDRDDEGGGWGRRTTIHQKLDKYNMQRFRHAQSLKMELLPPAIAVIFYLDIQGDTYWMSAKALRYRDSRPEAHIQGEVLEQGRQLRDKVLAMMEKARHGRKLQQVSDMEEIVWL